MSINILIVEDSIADTHLIKKKINTEFPYANTIIATSLLDAYKAYKKEKIGLILLDLDLPDGYGAQTVQEVRRFFKSEPIIVLSDMDITIHKPHSYQLGAVEFMPKTHINNAQFVDIIKNNMPR